MTTLPYGTLRIGRSTAAIYHLGRSLKIEKLDATSPIPSNHGNTGQSWDCPSFRIDDNP